MNIIEETLHFPGVSRVVLGDIVAAMHCPVLGLEAERVDDAIRFRCADKYAVLIRKAIQARIDTHRALAADMKAFIESEREKLRKI